MLRSSWALAVIIPVAVAVGCAYYVGNTVSAPKAGWQFTDVALSDEASTIDRAAKFLQFETVCKVGTELNLGDNRESFQDAKAFILESYSALLSRPDVKVTEVSIMSMVVEWTGSDPSLKPGMLYGHYDVVPVSDASLTFWSQPPFGGKVHDGYIWGRGAVDMKTSLIAMLEAWSHLHAADYKPARTMMLGIGHDEEIGGLLGAAKIAELLASRGVQLEVLFDEGTPVLVDGLVPLLSVPVALVGTAEKGCAAFRIEVDTPGGHSSMPPVNGAHTARVMADVIRAIDMKPPPVYMQPPLSDCLKAAAPYSRPLLRGILQHADKWPLNWVLARVWAASGHQAAAQVRTTAVPTILGAGIAQNIVPQHGEIMVDMRLMQDQGGDRPLKYLQERVDSTGWSRFVTVHRAAGIFGGVQGVNPSKVSAPHGHWWDVLSQAIQQSFSQPGSDGEPLAPSLPVVPSLLTGGTDSKHMGRVSDNVFRFLPLAMNRTAGDLGMLHGIDERIRTQDMITAVKFYVHLTKLFSA